MTRFCFLNRDRVPVFRIFWLPAIIFLCFSGSFAPHAFSQETLQSWDTSEMEEAQVLTLNQAIALGLQRNPYVRAAQAQLDLAIADVGEEGAKFLPAITGRIYQGIETLENNRLMDTGLFMEQPLYTGGKLTAGKKIAALNATIKEAALEQTYQDIAFAISEAYYTVVKDQLLVSAMESSLDRIKDHLRGLEIRLAKDLIPQVEVLKVRAELVRTQKETIGAKNDLEYAKSHFNTVINVEPERNFIFAKVDDYVPLALSLSECFKIANQAHPVLKQWGLKIETDAAAIQIPRSDLYPQINYFTDFDKREDVFINKTELKLGVSGTWILWDWFKTAHTVDQFKAALEETKARAEIAKSEIILKIRRDYFKALTDQQQITLSDKVLETAGVEYKNQLMRFKHGQTTNTEVLDSQATLTKSQIAYAQALGDSYITRASLANQIGVRDITPFESRGLSPKDDAFLDMIEKKAFLFFQEGQNMTTGLFLDASGGGDASIAACGMGLTALCVGASRGWMAPDMAEKRALMGIRAFLRTADGGLGAAEGKWGFFFHFLDPETGKRAHDSEISTVDTAILLAGAITAGEYFGGEVAAAAQKLYERMAWNQFLLTEQPEHAMHVSMGWNPRSGFLDSYWDVYSDETMLVDLLALGSPSHALAPEVFYAWDRKKGNYGAGPAFVCSYQGGLFTYQYAHLWFDFRGRVDAAGVDWDKNSRDATLTCIRFCLDNQRKFKGFGENAWGITSYDTPKGYLMSHGFSPTLAGLTLFDGTLAPSGPAGSITFTPKESIAALRHFYKDYPKLWGPYGFRDSFNLDQGWYSPANFALGTGLTLIAIENLRTKLIWKTFMRNAHVRKALERAKTTSISPKKT